MRAKFDLWEAAVRAKFDLWEAAVRATRLRPAVRLFLAGMARFAAL
jgi:hypothetical protein